MGEVETLVGCDVAVHLEHHHCERSTGLHVADDELGDDVQSDLDVCCCLDDADWEVEKERDQECDYECPPCQVGIPDKTGDETKSKHGHESSSIPGCKVSF